MNLTRTIESAEKQYKQILEEFFISVYNEKSLLSHGIDHHRRVWNYAKEFINLIPLKNKDKISHLLSELIIACYLHDIGMSVDPGEKHGKFSREFCRLFLAKNNLPQSNYKDLLEAIENHDNKDYSCNASMNELLTILSVADDLDAFGYIGIFRYSEIYLTRGIEPEKLGYLVRKNAEKRFDNFVKTFGSYSEIFQKHSKRYYILDNFFIEYNMQVSYYHFGTELPVGYCGVIEMFSQMITDKKELKELYILVEKYTEDQVIQWFFAGMRSDIG